MKKKVLISILAIALVATLAIGSTVAYIIVTDNATNTLTSGETKGEVIEEFPTDVIPSGTETTVQKEVSVTNTGNLPAFVRCRLVYSDTDVASQLTLLFENSELWIYDATTDFYYYKNVVAPGASTALLISGVVVPAASSLGSEFTISVYSELTHHVDHEGECSDTEYVDIWSSDAP